MEGERGREIPFASCCSGVEPVDANRCVRASVHSFIGAGIATCSLSLYRLRGVEFCEFSFWLRWPMLLCWSCLFDFVYWFAMSFSE